MHTKRKRPTVKPNLPAFHHLGISVLIMQRFNSAIEFIDAFPARATHVFATNRLADWSRLSGLVEINKLSKQWG